MSWTRVLTRSLSVTVEPPEIRGKERPRLDRNGRVYTPKKTQVEEQRVRRAWKKRNGDAMKEWDGPVTVHVVYSRPLAKSNPLYWQGRADLGKPDADNVAKLVLDALNGLAWADDAQVTGLHVTKQERTAKTDAPTLAIVVRYYTETHEK